MNNIRDKNRVNAAVRQSVAPCTIARLGHFVLHVKDHDASMAWLNERFNFLPSDYFVPPGEEGPIVGTFVRLDLGEQRVDHHFMLVLQSDWAGIHHSAFEVTDMDAVMSSHDYLLQQGYTSDVGVGRHLLGSQIFDYWKDPFGFRIEHYTDGDVVDHHHRPTKFNGTASETTQWGTARPWSSSSDRRSGHGPRPAAVGAGPRTTGASGFGHRGQHAAAARPAERDHERRAAAGGRPAAAGGAGLHTAVHPRT
ncbi:VOC family protein [Streptomyces sp. INA 01156]